MSEKVKFEDRIYDLNSLSDNAKKNLVQLKFTQSRLTEMKQMLKELQTSRKSRFNKIQKEVMSAKTGIILDQD